MLFTRTLGLTFVLASIFLIKPRDVRAASLPLFENTDSVDIDEELLPLTTTFKEFSWKDGSSYAGQTFIVSLNEPGQIQVTDYRNRGDRFDIYDNRLWIGKTSNTEFLRDIHGFARTPRHAIGDSHFSQGIFGLDRGTHIITIKATSPYGNGSGAIRLITGIEDQDNVETDADYLPPPIGNPLAEGNSTKSNATTSRNDESHAENPSSQLNETSDDRGKQDQNEDDNGEKNKDNEDNEENHFKDDSLYHGAKNSTAPKQENEDVPSAASKNLTSTTSSLHPATKSSKTYSTIVKTIVRTVFVDEPSATSTLASQTSEASLSSAISQATVSGSSEPVVTNAAQVVASQAFESVASITALPATASQAIVSQAIITQAVVSQAIESQAVVSQAIESQAVVSQGTKPADANVSEATASQILEASATVVSSSKED